MIKYNVQTANRLLVFSHLVNSSWYFAPCVKIKSFVCFNMKFLIFIAVNWHLCSQVISDNVKDPSNFCMDALYHKKAPGPEALLHGECTPWKDRACCNTNTTKNVDMMLSYNFTFDHCSHIKLMSSQCQTHFKRDMCFYECEPNLGPWVVQVKMKKRKERFYKVPLCASECNQWFEDCKHDYTCAKNWIKDFKWKQTNHCTQDCITFEEMYGNASNFCQLVWDGSWEYTADDEPCMKIWFDPANGNPNDAVFKSKMNSSNAFDSVFSSKIQSAQSGSISLVGLCSLIFIFMLVVMFSMFLGYVKIRDRFSRGSFLC